VVVHLATTSPTKAVMTETGLHLLRGREVMGFLTEKEADKLAAEWLAWRQRPTP